MKNPHRRTTAIRITANGILIALVLHTNFCTGQNTGNARASGTCIVSNTGSNAKIDQTCTIVDPELFKQFKALANVTRGNAEMIAAAVAHLEMFMNKTRSTGVLLSATEAS